MYSVCKNLSLEDRVAQLESLLLEAEKEDSGVIRKVGNKWKILRKDRKHYWNAEYDTKKDAEAALRAYWANKSESLLNCASLVERYKNRK